MEFAVVVYYSRGGVVEEEACVQSVLEEEVHVLLPEGRDELSDDFVDVDVACSV